MFKPDSYEIVKVAAATVGTMDNTARCLSKDMRRTSGLLAN